MYNYIYSIYIIEGQKGKVVYLLSPQEKERDSCPTEVRLVTPPPLEDKRLTV